MMAHEATNHEATTTPTAEASMAVLRAVVEATNRQDLAALRAHPGLHETVRYIPALWAAFPDLHHTVERQVAASDWVTTCMRARGTHRGAFMGVAPTGRELSFLVLSVDRVEAGRITLHYGLPDFLAIFGTLGLLPAWEAA
jgi:predicted ester cyclase